MPCQRCQYCSEFMAEIRQDFATKFSRKAVATSRISRKTAVHFGFLDENTTSGSNSR